MRPIGLARPLARLALWGLALLVLLPLAPLVLWSLAQRWFWPDLLPTEWGLRGWRYIVAPWSQVADAARTTLLLGLVTTGLALLIALPAARVLGRRDFRGKALLETLLLAPYLISPTAIALGLSSLFVRLHLNATPAGVVLALLIPTAPLLVRLLAPVFEALPPEFEEQARALGASPCRALLHVTIPVILPGVLAGSLFTFLAAINSFFYPYLIGGGQVQVLPVLLYGFMGAGGYDLPIAAALSLVLSLPGFLLLLAGDRLIREGYHGLGLGG